MKCHCGYKGEAQLLDTERTSVRDLRVRFYGCPECKKVQWSDVEEPEYID